MIINYEEIDNIGIINFEPGKILYEKIKQIKTQLKDLFDYYKDKEVLLLNLSLIDFIDSTSLGFFVKLKQTLEHYNVELALCSTNGKVNDILRYTGISPYFNIFQNIGQAKSFYKKLPANA